VSILRNEAKYTLLKLFCHQPNTIGWAGKTGFPHGIEGIEKVLNFKIDFHFW